MNRIRKGGVVRSTRVKFGRSREIAKIRKNIRNARKCPEKRNFGSSREILGNWSVEWGGWNRGRGLALSRRRQYGDGGSPRPGEPGPEKGEGEGERTQALAPRKESE